MGVRAGVWCGRACWLNVGAEPSVEHGQHAHAPRTRATPSQPSEARARNEDEAARLAEEEDLLRAEQEAVAESKRRAADELAERTRVGRAPPDSLKVAQAGGGGAQQIGRLGPRVHPPP